LEGQYTASLYGIEEKTRKEKMWGKGCGKK